MEFSHVSVLAEECIQALNLRPDGVYVDGTTGGGGHSLRIAQQLAPAGRLICIDRDEEALAAASRRLEAYRDRVTFVKSNFAQIAQVIEGQGLAGVDGILFDHCTEFLLTDTMAERKTAMIARADAFVMAPGGFGTLEEFFEVLTLKQLGRHNPAIAVLNTGGFYDSLQSFVRSAVERRFIRPACLQIYALLPTPEETLAYLEQYDAAALDVRHLKNI